jgi:transposase InsO family protein
LSGHYLRLKGTSSSPSSSSNTSQSGSRPGQYPQITSKTAQKFFWQNIVCRFGVPSELTVDNSKQFDSQDFRNFCLSIGTKPVFTLVYHPQSNGVVERANDKIFTAIKKRLLDEKKGKWADQLPEVVWALNTTE